MDYQQLLESTRKFRSKLLEPIGIFLLKFKITANLMTFISFIFGLASAYFLFQNHFLFIIFAAVHVLGDGLDGVLARLAGESILGKYLDYFSDRIIILLILIKIYLHLQDYYVILVIFLFMLCHAVHVFSKFKYPVIFFRTGGLIFLSFIPLFSFNAFLTTGYLGAGIISLYALLLQFRYFLITRTYPS